MPRSKGDFNVRHVSPEVQKTFRAIVGSSGKFRGEVGPAVTEALQLWIDKQLHAANIDIPGAKQPVGSSSEREVRIWQLLYMAQDPRIEFKDFHRMMIENRREIGLASVDARTARKYWIKSINSEAINRDGYNSFKINKDILMILLKQGPADTSVPITALAPVLEGDLR